MKKILCIILYLSVQSHVVAQHKQFAWLIGSWKLKDKNIFETWSISADSKTLEGYSFKIKDGDTIKTEVIRLTFDGRSYHYIPDVPGQQGPVDFVITSYDQQNFLAENPDHDFPKAIRYKFMQKEGADLIEASIEGNGKIITYLYQRLK